MGDNKLYEELYDDFLNSLEERRYKPIMCHKPSDVGLAKRFFKSYLTEEELCERQYTGRFWAIHNSLTGIYALYIIIDNEVYIKVDYDGEYLVTICDKHILKTFLPEELRGRYYDY